MRCDAMRCDAMRCDAVQYVYAAFVPLHHTTHHSLTATSNNRCYSVGVAGGDVLHTMVSARQRVRPPVTEG